MEKRNEILELSFEFALDIIEYSELLEEKKKFVIGRQLLKSGTSIGANVREAQNAHSRKNFVSKCVIAAFKQYPLHKEVAFKDHSLFY